MSALAVESTDAAGLVLCAVLDAAGHLPDKGMSAVAELARVQSQPRRRRELAESRSGETVMNLLKEVLCHEVYPALGCTEPISCAYAAAVAAAALDEPVRGVALRVDPGTFKNGAAVVVPHADGAKGNLVAAALGAVLGRSDARLELLSHVTPEVRRQAKRLLDSGACRSACLDGETDFRVEVTLDGDTHTARCVLAGSHTHIERVERDGRPLPHADDAPTDRQPLAYREALRRSDLATLLALAEQIDDDDRALLQAGIDMNLDAAEQGIAEGRTSQQLALMHDQGFLADDVFYRAKLRVAAAVDGRMNGAERPVMTSGGSGNQGIVAILTPVLLGRQMGVDQERLLRSLAAAHLVNGYVKCFVGELSAICGCTMAASIGAAVAIVYQQLGCDMPRIAAAVNNVIGDLSGLICDGAKPGCSMKAVTGVDTTIRSALMALQGCGMEADEGVVGRTAEDSIRNLARLTLEGMFQVDPTVLRIIQDKATRSGRA